MTIEENVNKYLKISGMTKQELSKILGVTYNSLWKTITGNPTIKTLEQIASALNCEAWQLLETNKVQPQELTLVCPHCNKPIKINITIEQ